jgi:hypothetical protein
MIVGISSAMSLLLFVGGYCGDFGGKVQRPELIRAIVGKYSGPARPGSVPLILGSAGVDVFVP